MHAPPCDDGEASGYTYRMSDTPPVITSLAALRRWNANPTPQLPIMLDWYLDWLFEQVLDVHRDFRLASESLEDFIRFTMICEKADRSIAVTRCVKTLNSYAQREDRWRQNLYEVYKRKGWA
jgi:hypothetical protein